MANAATDTHALIWYLENDPRLSPAANALFDECDHGLIAIYVPTICLVEIVYLQEKGRIPIDLKDRFDIALRAGRSGLVLADLTVGVADTLSRVSRAEVPDLPDRIIAATALHIGVPLISRDRKIRASSVTTIW
jgi:PIN domain nuclease of toxin-antitoxin system